MQHDSSSPYFAAHERDEQWFVDWFNNHFYMTVYRHRSQHDADRAVRLLLQSVPFSRGVQASTVLDVCCGAGRHVRSLLDAGLMVSGLDLSHALLTIAREAVGSHVTLYQCDMRAPYPLVTMGERYDCVTNFFTSFGYFSDHEDNCTVLRRVADALKPEGWFFFDFLNAPAVAETLIPQDSSIVETMTVVQKRWIADGFVKKEIAVIDEQRTRHEFTEQVRLYTFDDLRTMLNDVGLSVARTFGDYDGSPYTESAPRLILTACKTKDD